MMLLTSTGLNESSGRIIASSSLTKDEGSSDSARSSPSLGPGDRM